MAVKISPSILSCNFGRMEEEIRKAESAGSDYLHIDVMDGHFVNNLSMGMPIIENIRKLTKLPLDVHLMIDNPEIYADRYIDAGADIVSFHVEAIARPKSKRKLDEGYTVVFLDEQIIDDEKFNTIVNKVKSRGKKLSLAYNPSTMLEVVDPKYMNQLDMLLIMTVWPGFAGQKFIKFAVEKIRAARNNYPDMDIEVDGGITNETAAIAAAAGANVFVAGSYIFKSNDVSERVKLLRNAIN